MANYQSIKKRVFEVLEKADHSDKFSHAFDVFIIALIIVNVIAIIFESIDAVYRDNQQLFMWFEIISVIIFTIEYVLRIWSCTSIKKYENSLMGRLMYMLTPMAIIDLIAFLPFYLPYVIPIDLRFTRALRLFRFFRLLKLGRYGDTMETFKEVIKTKKAVILITVLITGILMVFVSSVLYYVEHEVQPEAFSSIPAAMWYGLATLTSTDAGVSPITPFGKMLGIIITFLGILLVALPVEMVASGFAHVQHQQQTGTLICPHCGKNVYKTVRAKRVSKKKPSRRTRKK